MNQLLLFCVNLLPEALTIKFVRFYVNWMFRRHARITVQGLEHLNGDLKRPFIFVSNHLSNSDGLVLNKVLEKENVIFLAGKKLEANSLTHLGFKIVRSIPILPSSPDKEAIKSVVAKVREGNSILVFPEGTRSRTTKLLEGKKGILLFAKLTNAPIVPIGIWGTERFIPIKEDMGKETFCDADININIGEGFNITPRGEGESKENWEANNLILIMTKIAELLPEEYRGFYTKEQEHL